MNTGLTRREFAAFVSASLLARPALAQTEPLLTRVIPSSGERIPAVGLGTASIFDTANEATRGKAAAVIQALIANGGRIIDTASTYGDAEIVVGNEMAAADLRDKIFIATKLESPDPAELKRSLADQKGRPAAIAQCAKIESVPVSV
jgi:aryl-alcohol dehydrogenase-like predicted oxidoreductase